MSSKSNILDRIKLHYKIKSNVDLAAFLGVTPQTISNWYSRDTIDFDKVLATCADSDFNWLLSDHDGHIRITKPTPYPAAGEQTVRIASDTTRSYTPSQRSSNPKMQSIPLYVADTAAELSTLLADADSPELPPAGHITLPDLPPCDGALYVRENLMGPKLENGSIVLYKTVRDIANEILWDEMYLLCFRIDGVEQVAIKYLRKGAGEAHVSLADHDSDCTSREIPLDSIYALARINVFVLYK